MALYLSYTFVNLCFIFLSRKYVYLQVLADLLVDALSFPVALDTIIVNCTVISVLLESLELGQVGPQNVTVKSFNKLAYEK